MGDHRADIKIELVMYGEKRTAEFSINWFPVGEHACDERIKEWFAETTDTLYYEVYVTEERRAAAEEERAERELYARLKAKYG